MFRRLSALAFLAAAGAISASSLAPSRVHPGTFTVEETPQFVCLGSDDNYYPDGLKWIVDLIKTKTNPTATVANPLTFDGAPATMSFYMNSFNSGWYNLLDTTAANEYGAAEALKIRGSLKDAITAGSELGCHTKYHMSDAGASHSYWQTEIDSGLIDLAAMGFNADSLNGFRTPFLQYNDSTFQVLATHSSTMKYDCSIESGIDEETDGSNFVWPYSLDNGVFSADLGSTPEAEGFDTIIDGTDTSINAKRVVVGNYPGLWETPAYCVVIPPELRHQIWLQRLDTINVKIYQRDAEGNLATTTGGDFIILDTVIDSVFENYFDTLTGKVTGLDYNMFSSPANGGYGMDSAQFVAVMKYNLDQRLNGNRAPFCYGMHSNIFYDNQGFTDESSQEYGSMTSPPRVTVTQARNAIAAFIDYALSKKAVRLVSQRELVGWCESPSPLSAPVAINSTMAVKGLNVAVHSVSGAMIVSGLPANATATLSLFNLSGRQVAQTTTKSGSVNWKLPNLAAGSYLLKMSTPDFQKTASFIME